MSHLLAFFPNCRNLRIKETPIISQYFVTWCRPAGWSAACLSRARPPGTTSSRQWNCFRSVDGHLVVTSRPDMHLLSLTICQDHKGFGYSSMDVSLSDTPSLATTALLKCKTNLQFKVSIRVRVRLVDGPRVWNSLPDFIRDPPINAECFRRLLKTFLFARY